MRFTILAHSSLYIETPAGSILVDPWLVGSAGWRSWWHDPPCAASDIHFRPDFVYITHHHPDHFHYPTMRRIDRRARVLVPKFGVDVMMREVRGLGFDDVTELTHGEPFELGRGVRVASFQYGFDDTAFVVQDANDALVDLNDCKVRGRPLQEIARTFGRPSALLKGYSFAQAYPHCYSADDPRDLELVSRDTYFDDFIGAAEDLKPRYAVPFASMVAFLHPENRHVNQHSILPPEVESRFRAAVPKETTEIVCMSPGDIWDSRDGFEISSRDWFSGRAERLDQMAAEVSDKIDRSLAEEAERSLEFEVVQAYFESFSRAVPRLASRALFSRSIAFDVGSEFFVLDLRRRRVTRESAAPAATASVIRIAPGLLADAIDKRLVHIIHGTMRLRTHLRPGGANEDLAFWGLLAMWELGYLPWTRVASGRLFDVLWRRRSEVAAHARAFFTNRTLFGGLSRGFGARGAR